MSGSPTKEWLMDLTLTELVSAIQSKKATPLESIEACFARVRSFNPLLNALVVICEHEALMEAKDQTERILKGKSSTSLPKSIALGPSHPCISQARRSGSLRVFPSP